MKKNSLLFFPAVALLSVLLFQSCERDVPEPPENPYDSIDYGNTVPRNDTLSPASITGLHRNIFLTRCAVPGCHDGNFEPDFRSVQSSYSTLVYAPVTKNNAANEFKYRVVPGDKESSVLYERITNCCFVNENDRMPQDNIGTPLPEKDIRHIGEWISNGAKDMNGQTPGRPDLEPVLALYVAVNTTFNVEYSAASNRADSLIYNSFRIPASAGLFYVVPFVTDDHTPVPDLQYNKLYLSKDMDDFSAAIQLQAVSIFVPQEQQHVWVATVPTAGFQPGETWYMRYYVNDGFHAQNTEFPKTSSLVYYKTYWSFTVVP